MKFIWIDDDPERKVSCENLQNHLDIETEFKDVKQKDIVFEIKKILQEPEPDLILIDHNLINIKNNDNQEEILKVGASVASVIRAKWKECPIICVSGMDIDQLDTQQKSIYEDVFPIANISKHYNDIRSVADSFNYIKKNRPQDTDDLLSLLNCPNEEKHRLLSVIPKDLKENFADGGLIVEISDWVRKTLIKWPGFLYDSLWSATALGLTVEGFKKVQHLFNNAKYEGIFSQEDSPRWWKTKLLLTLSEIVEVDGLSWEKGRALANIIEADHSKCYVSGEDYPETVAYIDDTKNLICHPMKLKYTTPHKLYDRKLYFDEIRLMKPAE